MGSLPARDVTGLSLHALLDLDGRTAVVTGGAQGIGHAIANRLAEAGATVIIADINERGAEQAAQTISERWNTDARGLMVDVRDPAAVEALAELADGVGSGLAIWVNNAGVYPASPLTAVGNGEWDLVTGVTLSGTFYGCRAAARRMIARSSLPGRVIINVSSVAGLRGRSNLASYVAAKHGVSGLVRSLAIELGGAGIRVLGIAPSIVDTPGMRERRDQAAGADAERLRALEEGLTSSIPLARAGVPDDVARMAVYCASDLSEFVSGVVIPVDGGLSSA